VLQAYDPAYQDVDGVTPTTEIKVWTRWKDFSSAANHLYDIQLWVWNASSTHDLR